jgi:hypothetical protein
MNRTWLKEFGTRTRTILEMLTAQHSQPLTIAEDHSRLGNQGKRQLNACAPEVAVSDTGFAGLRPQR